MRGSLCSFRKEEVRDKAVHYGDTLAADPAISCSTVASIHILQQIHTLLNALVHLLAALLHLLLQHTGSRSSHNKTL
jgi:hypothetical protein